jgi:DNA replication protein DnaC
MNKDTLKKMGDMRLHGMQTAFKTFVELPPAVSFTNDEMAQYLVQNEWDDRKHRSLQRNIKTAKFRYMADVDGIDFGNKRELDKNQIDRLFTCEFIKKGQDVFITGSTGTGKSYLASAIGRQACLFGFKVYYTNTAKLLSILKMAKADGSHLRELARIEKQDLLILDDFGIQSFDASGRALLMDIVEDRHGKHSTIIASQVPVKNWYDVIGEQTVADAILDRLVHQSVRVELKGESLRKIKKENTTEEPEKTN